MTLENLLSLIGGKLLSHPSITGFGGISDRVSQIQRGDLFICVDQDQTSIDEALSKGAYGIVFDKHPAHIDNETAWIEVDSAFEAHLKLLRFHLMPKQLEVYYSDIYTLEYIQMLQTSSECKTISSDISELVSRLWNLQDTKKLLLRDQPEILTLFPMAKEISLNNELSLKSVTPFESDLAFEDLFYHRLRIPTVLHSSFLKALAFLSSNHLPFDLSKLTFVKSFTMISCDKFLSAKEFGKGSLNLLFTSDTQLAEAFLTNIEELTPWVKTKLFLNKNLKNLSYNKPIIFEDENQLIETLQNSEFGLGVVCGASPEILSLAARPQQLSLF